MSNKKALHKDRSVKILRNENGFSLVEAVIAIFILTVALMGTAAALSYAFQFGTTSRNVGNARLIIISTLEETESLRNSKRLEFKQISNVGSVDNTDKKNTYTGFSTAYLPLALNPGPDGINGTPDDLRDPGPDGLFGTADDFDNPALARSGFTRRITITTSPLTPTIKRIEVNVRYSSPGGTVSEITGVGYLNNETRIEG